MPYLLSIVTFLPLAGGFCLLLIPSDNKRLQWSWCLLVTLATLLMTALVWISYIPGGFSEIDYLKWMPSLGISYFMGIDGISLLMVAMTALIFPFVVGISAKEIDSRTKAFYFLILLVETAIIGVFTSLNLVLFYIFYEAMLIPLYFLVGMWGGANRTYATMKFFLYTMVGSMLMLVSILSIYFLVGTFDYVPHDLGVVGAKSVLYDLPGALMKLGPNGPMVEMLLFLGFFAAFAVKSPVFPLHTWVPDAYAEAPTGASIILVALKMGLYGFIRFNLTLFPNATHEAAPVIIALAVIGVIYGALIAAMQTDLKRLIAYSSISHVGVIVLAIFGLTAIGIDGAVVQMFSHTIVTGALFILVALLYNRRGSYNIADYGGVWKVMPAFTAVFLIVILASVALPGTSGFTGEFLMLAGAFLTNPWAAGVAATAAIWSVVYMLWMFQRVTNGKIDKPEVAGMRDVTSAEMVGLLAPLVIVIIFLGVYPAPVLGELNTGSVRMVLLQDQAPAVAPGPIPDVRLVVARPGGRFGGGGPAGRRGPQ